jgi:hypothetical protein
MAAPNIVSPTTITLKQLSTTVGTAAITLVTCAADRAVKLSTLYAANVDGTSAGDITIRVSRWHGDSRRVQHGLGAC